MAVPFLFFMANGLLGGLSSLFGGRSQSKAYKAAARNAENQAQTLRQNVNTANNYIGNLLASNRENFLRGFEQGRVQAGQFSEKQRQYEGSLNAAVGASGISSGSNSMMHNRASSGLEFAKDRMNLNKSIGTSLYGINEQGRQNVQNARRQAAEIGNQAESAAYQANAYRTQAKNAWTQGVLGAVGQIGGAAMQGAAANREKLNPSKNNVIKPFSDILDVGAKSSNVTGNFMNLWNGRGQQTQNTDIAGSIMQNAFGGMNTRYSMNNNYWNFSNPNRPWNWPRTGNLGYKGYWG